MRFTAMLAWAGGIWVAAGVEAARGGGAPGPLFLLAVAAGLWAGLPAGLVTGALVGLCSATLCGRDLCWFIILGMAAGGLASILPTWMSNRHLLVGILSAAVISFPIALLTALHAGLPVGSWLWLSALRSGENALWMIPIYGIVLLASPRQESIVESWGAQ